MGGHPAAHFNALFSEYLFKIRRWSGSRDVPKEGFTTSDIGMVEKYGESHQSLKFHYMAALQSEAKEWGPHQISSQGAAMRKVLLAPLSS